MGLLLGGILTTYVSWRWVLFVNVPIGILVAAAAPRVLAESPRRPGRVDVAGAVTGTGGIALLVYGLSKAATGPDGVSHWGDAQVLASLAAAVVLLVSFVLIERRSSRPLLPMRVLADRNRSGAYLIMLCVATGLFALFFFLTLFIQDVLGYSAIRTGIAYLPFAVGVVVAAAKAGRPVPKPGAPLPVSIYDHALTAGFSRAFLVAAGIGLLALLIAIATIRVRRQDLAGAAPTPQEAAPPPATPQSAAAPQPAAQQLGTVQRDEARAALAAAARPCRLC